MIDLDDHLAADDLVVDDTVEEWADDGGWSLLVLLDGAGPPDLASGPRARLPADRPRALTAPAVAPGRPRRSELAAGPDPRLYWPHDRLDER